MWFYCRRVTGRPFGFQLREREERSGGVSGVVPEPAWPRPGRPGPLREAATAAWQTAQGQDQVSTKSTPGQHQVNKVKQAKGPSRLYVLTWAENVL